MCIHIYFMVKIKTYSRICIIPGKVSTLDFLCFVKSFESTRLAKDILGFGNLASFHVHAMFLNPPPQNLPFASGTPYSRVTMEKSNQYAQQSQAGNAASPRIRDKGYGIRGEVRGWRWEVGEYVMEFALIQGISGVFRDLDGDPARAKPAPHHFQGYNKVIRTVTATRSWPCPNPESAPHHDPFWVEMQLN